MREGNDMENNNFNSPGFELPKMKDDSEVKTEVENDINPIFGEDEEADVNSIFKDVDDADASINPMFEEKEEKLEETNETPKTEEPKEEIKEEPKTEEKKPEEAKPKKKFNIFGIIASLIGIFAIVIFFFFLVTSYSNFNAVKNGNKPSNYKDSTHYTKKGRDVTYYKYTIYKIEIIKYNGEVTYTLKPIFMDDY